jgi:cation diffusion facilitator CzcD-associated flavoprotein CzcO
MANATSGRVASAAPMQEAGPATLDVVVIGAGLSGLCIARHLQRAGFSYRLLEQAHDIGGTWRDNTYPGCGCDIPSPLYSFSFAQRSNWTRLFATQPEIWSICTRSPHGAASQNTSILPPG